MKIQLWLLQTTAAALKFQTAAPGKPPGRELWIPRSVCKSILKYPVDLGVWQRRCDVDVADWFAEKQGL